MGKEFYNTDMQKILKKYDVNHYSTYSTLKASVVERFNQSQKRIWKIFTLNGNYSGSTSLPRLVSDYNACKHRTIRDRRKTWIRCTARYKSLAKFKVSNSIRVSKYKMIFEKGYTLNWTTEMFMIVKMQGTNLITYLLEDYRGKSVWSTSYIALLIRTCISWRKYCAGRETRYTLSG